jgi:hypothetical protein
MQRLGFLKALAALVEPAGFAEPQIVDLGPSLYVALFLRENT